MVIVGKIGLTDMRTIPPVTIVRIAPSPTAIIRTVPTPSPTAVPGVVPTAIPTIARAVPSPIPRVVPIVGITPRAPERIVIPWVYDRDIGIWVYIDIGVGVGRTYIVIIIVEHCYPACIATLRGGSGFVGRAIVFLFGSRGVEFGQHGFVFGFACQSLLFLKFGFGGFTFGDLGAVMNIVKIARRRQGGRRTPPERYCNSSEE
jgi:hypothetical protein